MYFVTSLDNRNPGKQYGGALNVTHMGIYVADTQHLHIILKETTIIRRRHVPTIKVRAMAVVNTFGIIFAGVCLSACFCCI